MHADEVMGALEVAGGLEEPAQSIGGVLFEAELAVAECEQHALAHDLAVVTPGAGGGPDARCKGAPREPLERVPTEAVMGPAWTSEVCTCNPFLFAFLLAYWN